MAAFLMSRLLPDIWHFANLGHVVFAVNSVWLIFVLQGLDSLVEEKIIEETIGAGVLEWTALSSNPGSASD